MFVQTKISPSSKLTASAVMLIIVSLSNWVRGGASLSSNVGDRNRTKICSVIKITMKFCQNIFLASPISFGRSKVKRLFSIITALSLKRRAFDLGPVKAKFLEEHCSRNSCKSQYVNKTSVRHNLKL